MTTCIPTEPAAFNSQEKKIITDDERLILCITERQQLIEADVERNDDGRSALNELERIEAQIMQFDLSSEGAFRSATKLLFSGEDEPNFADDFKNDLFNALRQARAR